EGGRPKRREGNSGLRQQPAPPVRTQQSQEETRQAVQALAEQRHQEEVREEPVAAPVAQAPAPAPAQPTTPQPVSVGAPSRSFDDDLDVPDFLK
ncbi:MAG: cell division protein FtsZ, partial [Marmoricola sp.]